MRIDWTPHAKVDLIAIHDYIAADSPINAVRMVNRLISSV
jgi:plasmid stabilization system protein ParE